MTAILICEGNALRKRAIISVNISVLLFGLAGLFAKWIQLPAISITFGRVLFSSIALSIFILVKKQSFQIRDKRDGMLLIAAGIILALHWWTFLKAIQLSTVAIGTITFSTFPLFVTILEPLVYHRRLKPRNILIACLILLGVIVTIPEFSIENHLFLVGIDGDGGNRRQRLSATVLANSRRIARFSSTISVAVLSMSR